MQQQDLECTCLPLAFPAKRIMQYATPSRQAAQSKQLLVLAERKDQQEDRNRARGRHAGHLCPAAPTANADAGNTQPIAQKNERFVHSIPRLRGQERIMQTLHRPCCNTSQRQIPLFTICATPSCNTSVVILQHGGTSKCVRGPQSPAGRRHQRHTRTKVL